MKKAIVAVLVVLTVFCAAISVCAADDYIVVDAADLLAYTSSDATAGLTHNSELVYSADNKRSFVKIYPNGEAEIGSDKTKFEFKLDTLFENYNAKDYPYIKIGYKASIASNQTTDVNVGVNYDGVASRLWGKRVTVDNSGTDSTLIIDLKSFKSGEHATASEYSYDKIGDEPISYLRLKPYYGSSAISQDDYFLVEYIGIFKTETDAIAYDPNNIEIGVHYTLDARTLSDITSVSGGISKTFENDRLKIYADGEYSNVKATISFANYDILIKEFPVVKIKYKTNINSTSGTMKVDFNISSTYDNSGTRTSFRMYSYKPEFTSDARENIFIDLLDNNSLPNSTLGNGTGFNMLDEESEYDSFLLKLWNSTSNKSSADTYFEIESIGFYKTESDAENDEPVKEETVLIGDVDADGEITATDGVVLSRVLAKWVDYVCNETNSDVNLDSEVTSVDSVILSRYLAKWTGYAKLPIIESVFLNNAELIGTTGSMEKTYITAEESEAYGLDFTETLTVSCDTASSITAFGVACDYPGSGLSTESGDIVQLTFYARAKNENTKVKAAIVTKSGNTLTNTAGSGTEKAEYTYFIPTQWTKICLPVTVPGSVGGLRLYMGSSVSDVEFGGVTLEKAEDGAEQISLPAGYFLCEPYTHLLVDYNSSNYIEMDTLKKSMAIETHGDYIYALSDGKLWIISIKDNKIVSSVGGLSEIRQLALNEDATTAVVTSRVDGAFVIALEDKNNPKIVGRCDTLEYATGVAVANDFAYITNRYFGVEVIDISDRTLPKNIAIMRTGEAQSCQIVGTTLYAGCWGGRFVEAWDVSQPSNPVLLNKNIKVNGKGDGLFVKGNYLYVATGHDENNTSAQHPLNAGFGMGNGMDIYDISDINNPIHLSTVRIEDHYYMRGQDFWTVKVAENDGKTYAYLSNTMNGVYIYDVTDPKAPIRLAAIELTATKAASKSKYDSLVKSYGHTGVDANKYFPFDTNVRHNTPIGGFAITDGKIYLGGADTGIAVLDTSDLGNILYAEFKATSEVGPSEPDGTFYDIDLEAIEAAGFTDVAYTVPGGQVYGVDYKDGYIYAACGNQGIKILNEELELLKEISPVEGAIVSEIVIHGNRIYTAEGLKGIAIYELSEDGMSLTEISRYLSQTGNKTRDYSVKFIRLSPDGNYVLCDSGSSHSELVDFTDLDNPVRWNDDWNGHNGLMYWRQISTNLINGRYTCSYGNANQVYWYDFGTDPENSTPELMYINPKCGVGQGCGYAGLSGKNSKYAIGLTENKFFIFDPAACDESTSYAALPHYEYTNNFTGDKIKGKPTIHGDIMFVNERQSGNCYVFDLSELDVEAGVFTIKLIAHFKVAGNPDLADICGDKIIYPLGNQGILSVKLAK